MRNFQLLAILLLSFFVLQCTHQEEKKEGSTFKKKTSRSAIKYAKGFEIEDFGTHKIITLRQTWKKNNQTHQYVLYQNEKPADILGATFFKVPITSIACMSLTHVAFLEKLGEEHSIVGISGCDYVHSAKINAKIANHTIHEIGQNQQIDYEFLVDKSPQIVMAYGINSASSAILSKLEKLGLKTVLNSEYMETHPLGKAEWIKFVAAFYNKSNFADSLFNSIEQEYLALLEITNKTIEKPTVFTGMPWSGSWYVPGAKSFQAQLFKDAGATYLWQNNNEKSSVVKSKELIIDEAYNASFWLNQDSYKSINAVVAYDENFRGFEAVEKEQLYNNDNRLNARGGNDYWESGVVNPQWILKDLIKIFHPQLITHQLYYYRKLTFLPQLRPADRKMEE